MIAFLNIPPQLWPLVVLIVCVAFIIITITRLRLHPFLALILAALLAGVLTIIGPVPSPHVPALTDVVRLTMEGFGKTAGGIALSIGLAAIIACCLMLSGAADCVVKKFLTLFGEKRAGLALLVSTYVLSIPIFFDTMFMLMVPLAIALHRRTGKDFLLYILCICAGGVIPHSLTVPHPGPIAMVENLKIDAGYSIIVGIIAGIIPAAIGYGIAHFLNKRITIPLRIHFDENDSASSTLPSPPFLLSLTPVVLPILLIGLSSCLKIFHTGTAAATTLTNTIHFIGDKNIALLIGAFISMVMLKRGLTLDFHQLQEKLEGPLTSAAMVILITAAGGAFGSMIKNAGVGESVQYYANAGPGALIILSYLITLVIRVAQGSATVAMLTASQIVYPMISPDMPFHTVYLFLSIGFAAFSMSWMNDSGFWVVSKLSGMTERETLRTFSTMLTILSLCGLALTWLGSVFLPLI